MEIFCGSCWDFGRGGARLGALGCGQIGSSSCQAINEGALALSLCDGLANRYRVRGKFMNTWTFHGWFFPRRSPDAVRDTRSWPNEGKLRNGH